MSDKEVLLEEIKRLSLRLAAYEVAVERMPDMCKQLINEIEKPNGH